MIDIERLKREAARLNLQLVEAKPPLTPEEQRKADLHAAMRLMFARMVEDVQRAYANGSDWLAGCEAIDWANAMQDVIAWSDLDCDFTTPYEKALVEWSDWGHGQRGTNWP